MERKEYETWSAFFYKFATLLPLFSSVFLVNGDYFIFNTCDLKFHYRHTQRKREGEGGGEGKRKREKGEGEGRGRGREEHFLN